MFRTRQKGESLEIIVAIIVCAVIFAPFWYLKNKYESDTYNKLCNVDTTFMDAVFAELRVDGNCRGGY